MLCTPLGHTWPCRGVCLCFVCGREQLLPDRADEREEEGACGGGREHDGGEEGIPVDIRGLCALARDEFAVGELEDVAPAVDRTQRRLPQVWARHPRTDVTRAEEPVGSECVACCLLVLVVAVEELRPTQEDLATRVGLVVGGVLHLWDALETQLGVRVGDTSIGEVETGEVCAGDGGCCFSQAVA